MLQRLVFAAVGLFVWGLVAWATKAGWYPARGERVYRKTQPGVFWPIMTLGAVFGGVFVLFGLCL